MKTNLFILSAAIGFSFSLTLASEAGAATSLYCAGQTSQALQQFMDENNPFLLKLGFGDLDREFRVLADGKKTYSKIENGSWLDYSDLMKKYLKNKFTYNQMSYNQLKLNIRAYEAVKAAKELGLYIGALTLPCIQEDAHREALAELTAYLMKLKPLDISDAVASQVQEQLKMDLNEASQEKPQEVNKILQAQLKVAIKSHTDHLTSVLAEALFNGNFSSEAARKHISKLLTPLVHLAYMDHQIGRTQWLGRALIALLLRNGGAEALPVLKEELKENGITIENYAGEAWLLDSENSSLKEAEEVVAKRISKLHKENKISFAQALQMKDKFDKQITTLFQKKDDAENQDNLSLKDSLKNTWSALKNNNFSGTELVDQALTSVKTVSEKLSRALSYKTKQMPIPVHTMSYVLTRNINFESALTPSLALPGNEEIGKKFNLIGSLLSGLNVIDAQYVTDKGYDVAAQIKDRSFYRVLNNGFSHIGYVAVRRADGVSMTWIVDNYPTPTADNEIDVPGAKFNAGGIRWVGLEQFYKASQHSRISVMTPDPALFHEYAKPQIQKWLEKIDQGQEILGTKMYNAYRPVLDAAGKPTRVENPVDDPWTMEIDSATFKKIHQHENSEEWFNSVTESAMDKIQDFMYQGMTFVWITPYGQYFKGGAYCSFTGILGWSLGTGLDPLSTHKDKWSPLIQSLANIHGQAKKKLKQLESSKMSAEQKETLSKKLVSIVENGKLQEASISVSMDIYTPSGLPAQSYVPLKNVFQAQAPFRDVYSRYDLLFDKTSKVSPNFSLTYQMPASEAEDYSVELDPSETTGILLDLLEVNEVKYSK